MQPQGIELRARVAAALADGCFHSGESLATMLSVSRSTIWQHLQYLQQAGLEIQAVRGKGYRIAAGLDLLDPHRLQQDLPECLIDYRPETTSTNADLMQAIRHGAAIHKRLCISEYQGLGRGRRGRSWVSPYAHGLCLSLGWCFEPVPDGMSGLGLAVGITLMQVMEVFGLSDAGLKWPNDVLVNGDKLAGVLIEMQVLDSSRCEVVVGIGINVRACPGQQAQVDQKLTSLDQHLQPAPGRQELTLALAKALQDRLQTYARHGFSAFTDLWQHYDLLQGREVCVHGSDSVISGRMQGVDTNGALLLLGQNGTQRFFSGDVSIRPVS